MRIAVVLAAVAALGCDKNGTSTQTGVSSSCTVTLSGSISGSYDCRPATTLWSSADNKGDFSFGVTASGTRPAISLAILWPGQPKDTAYTNADSAAQAAVSITTSTNQVWQAAVGPGVTATGSYTLVFSSLVVGSTNATGIGYSADGTLNATLTAVTASGASGVVLVTATF